MERLKQFSETRLEATDESAISWSIDEESELRKRQVNLYRRTTPRYIHLSNRKTVIEVENLSSSQNDSGREINVME